MDVEEAADRATRIGSNSCRTIFVFGLVGPLIGFVLVMLVELLGDQRGFVKAADAFFGSGNFEETVAILLVGSYLAGTLPALICGVVVNFFDRSCVTKIPRWLLALLAGFLATACMIPWFLPYDSELIAYAQLFLTFSAIGGVAGAACHFLTVRFGRHSRDKLEPRLRSD